MLEDFTPTSDEAKRQLYVAMTRAKESLIIHLDSSFLDNLSVENLERVENNEDYLPPNEMLMQLTHKDVWLDYFINKQQVISQLKSGDSLTLNEDECYTSKGQSVLKFSKQFIRAIKAMGERGYELKGAKVNFIYIG